jgi:type VI secretion system protein ImpM
MMDRKPVVQLFGKLPSHGDFVSRGLAAGERDALDSWLSAELDTARKLFEDAFDDLYDRAPPWFFQHSEGPAGHAGVLAPSIDRAGRRYPVYLALLGIDGTTGEAAARWCEEMLHQGFAGGWDADRLAGQAAAFSIRASLGPARGTVPGWWSDGGEGFSPGAIEGLRPERLLSLMLQPEENS